MSLKSAAARNLMNLLGWHTKRKLVIIESDDWGSVRMPSSEIYLQLLEKGLKVDNHYNRFDSLATSSDLEYLFELLTSVKDVNSNNPVITANCLLANPDFQRIKADGFETYYYELFTDTLKKQKGCENSFSLWEQGIKGRIFKPQFHGREHLNIELWLRALRDKHLETLFAFDRGFWGQTTSFALAKQRHFLAAYDFLNKNELHDHKQTISEGLRLFEEIFKYKSCSFVAPNYIWHSDLESFVQGEGVSCIKGQRRQLIPVENNIHYQKKWRYTGQLNSNRQIYLSLNAFFEPSENPQKDWVGSCIKDIWFAFHFKKPAIIGCHRVNFIGAIDVRNRDANLLKFKILLQEIKKRWPEAEFLDAEQLGRIMLNDIFKECAV